MKNKKTPKISLKFVIHDESNAKYEGKPLIEPKIPYQYVVKTFKTDPDWTTLQRYNKKMRFVSKSIFEYGQDIFFWRIDPVAFKTAEFVKRNWNWFRTTCQHIVYEIRKIKQGFGRFKRDVKFMVQTTKT